MKTVLIFACVILFFQNTRADWEHPQYNFRCHESEKDGIDIFGLHDRTNVTVTNGSASCLPPKEYYKTGEKLNIPYSCTMKLTVNDTVIGSYLEIHVIDPKFDNVETTTTSIIGGHSGHNFIIICKNIPEKGIEKTVANVFQGGPNILPVQNKEVSSVEMHFRATNNSNAPDISEIYIGDAFYMFLEYTGKNSYWIKPKICNAYKGSVTPTKKDTNMNNITLWDGSVNDGVCAKHKELLKSMESTENKAVVATMFGFKFLDSEYITVTCEVVIYPSPLNGTLCTHATTGRRRTLRLRREMLDTPFQRKSIIRKLKVNDHYSEYSNSANNFQGPFGCFWNSLGVMVISVLFRESW